MMENILKECGKIVLKSALAGVVTIGTFAVIGELVNIKEKLENSKNEEK